MISKEEFVRQVEKEINILASNEVLKKQLYRIDYRFFLGKYLFLFCTVLWLVLALFTIFIEPYFIMNIPLHSLCTKILLIFSFVVLATSCFYEGQDRRNQKKAKLYQKDYEKILLLLGVKKITDKCFKEFARTHFLEPAVSPAYKVGRFIIQNFCNRCPKATTPRHLLHMFGPLEADISIFYEGKNFLELNLIKNIRKLCKGQVKCAYPLGNNKKNIKCHYIYRSSPRFEDKSPLLFVDKAAAYYLFISSERNEAINQIYNEISLLSDLSEQYQKI